MFGFALTAQPLQFCLRTRAALAEGQGGALEPFAKTDHLMGWMSNEQTANVRGQRRAGRAPLAGTPGRSRGAVSLPIHLGRAAIPRKIFVATDRLGDYDPRSRRSRGPTAWGHSTGSSRMHGADGERIAGDGVRRESASHPVVAGTALGRPSNAYEATMLAAPFEEPQEDSEALQASMARVDAMLALLPAQERRALVLCVLEGRSLREAAVSMGMSKSQVDRYLHRALAATAELLGGELPTPEAAAALAELAPDEAPELGDYQQPAAHKAELPEVGADDWHRYQAAQARVNAGTALKLDFAYMVGFEKRSGLPSSFSPAWR